MIIGQEPVPEDLRRIAAAHGVATTYRNERRVPVEVDADVVVRVLALLDVDAGSEAARRDELIRLEECDRAGVLAPTVAVRMDGSPHTFPGAVALVGEDGGGSTWTTSCLATCRRVGTG